MLDLGSYLISFSIGVAGAVPATIVAYGQSAPGGVNGQASMLFNHGNGMQAVLNTTLFSNTSGAATVAGRDATLYLDGQFYAPRRLYAAVQPGQPAAALAGSRRTLCAAEL
ncbi:Uncharacterised protein [Serratia rubidaea]|uniref:Uncharacterized protein n=1 Tax=Serratia rubidaea TaxID=61652 RepID=A0A4U9HVK0_SERRU|nr:Uncharacterised protein [Serratia rubidaea]